MRPKLLFGLQIGIVLLNKFFFWFKLAPLHGSEFWFPNKRATLRFLFCFCPYYSKIQIADILKTDKLNDGKENGILQDIVYNFFFYFYFLIIVNKQMLIETSQLGNCF
jgi:hypothetical protein